MIQVWGKEKAQQFTTKPRRSSDPCRGSSSIVKRGLGKCYREPTLTVRSFNIGETLTYMQIGLLSGNALGSILTTEIGQRFYRWQDEEFTA